MTAEHDTIKDQSSMLMSPQEQAMVQIVGPNMLQNSLLVSYLEKETGLKCVCSHQAKQSLNFEGDQAQKYLIIRDCHNADIDHLWQELEDLDFPERTQCLVALCNMEPKNNIETEAMARNVRGIFYTDETLERLCKGVSAILNGELWFSRKILSKCLLESRSRPIVATKKATKDTPLTIREKEILRRVSSGLGNKEIAADLSISAHTVKTHLYNIYKKINATNRLQASLWGAKNL
jgi:DNA-binding NarL/FixJ family response regulator